MEDLRGFNIIFGITQLFGIVTVIFVAILTAHYGKGFAWRSDPGREFNWHPLLMTIGFIYLFGNSIMIYRSLRNLRKYRLKVFHATIHTVVVVCVIIALVAVFDSHNLKTPPIPNLYTLHIFFSLLLIKSTFLTFFFYFQWALGILVYLYPGGSLQIRSAMMSYHVFFGLTIFVCAVAAALTGLMEKAIFSVGNYGSLPAEGVLFNLTGLFFIIFAGLVVYIVTESKYKRYPRPEDGALLTPTIE
ncbi:hypothetical protein AAG570_002434 [Ranatra chinensis]|uniref:Cytochrome b561 domain-containing protein n=1 Tax=Ranatra chinensis TaxID=642074 RepID=A0ABD0Y9L1_9HEMI